MVLNAFCPSAYFGNPLVTQGVASGGVAHQGLVVQAVVNKAWCSKFPRCFFLCSIRPYSGVKFPCVVRVSPLLLFLLILYPWWRPRAKHFSFSRVFSGGPPVCRSVYVVGW